MGLRESLNLGQSSHLVSNAMLFPLGGWGTEGTGCGAREGHSDQDGVAERLSCCLAALVKMVGRSPPWVRAKVEAGACAHWPRGSCQWKVV